MCARVCADNTFRAAVVVQGTVLLCVDLGVRGSQRGRVPSAKLSGFDF